jgi:hypothetical protein
MTLTRATATRAAVLAVALALLTTDRAAAQARRMPPNDPDMAELAAYRLTTVTLQKVGSAMQYFLQALQSDPRYKGYVDAQKELKTLSEKDHRTPADERRIAALEQELENPPAGMDMGDAATLAQMERALVAMPHMSEALAKAGLTAREYAKFNLAMIQAGFLAGMKKAGQLREVPPGASMENVQFMIDHEREIAALTSQMQGR